MAKIVDVTDVPEFPGAGLLHFDDGRPPLMALPEIADEHRERLGMSAMQDGVAGPGAADPDAWKTKFGGTLGKVLPDAPAPPPPAPAPSPAPPQPGPQGAEGVPPMLARPPEPVPGEAPSERDQALAASDARLNQALITGVRPGGGGGSSPVTPAGFRPEMQKTVTETGPAYDPRAAGERVEAAGAVLDAQLAKAASEKQQADAMAAHAAAQHAAALRQVADAKAEALRKQEAFKQEDSHLQRDLAEYSEAAKPDPNKFWSTPAGAYSGFLSIIGQALGAFGASLGHTENYAFKAAQQKIQMEMAAQEKAYDAGRGDRKNALARLADYYHGDMDKAKLALSQALNKVAETETLSFAAQSRSKDITANAQVLAAQFQQQQLLNEQARAELAQGKTTTTAEEKFHQASGGAARPNLTLEEELALRKGLKPEGLSAKSEKKYQIDYGKSKQDEAAARTSLTALAKQIGATWDQKTQSWVAPNGVSVSGHGITGWVPNAITTQEGRDFRRTYQDVLSQTIKLRSGASATEAEVDRLNQIVGGTYDSDLLGGLNQLQKEQDAAAHARDAGYGPDIVQSHEDNRRGVVQKAQTDKAYAPEERDDE